MDPIDYNDQLLLVSLRYRQLLKEKEDIEGRINKICREVPAVLIRCAGKTFDMAEFSNNLKHIPDTMLVYSYVSSIPRISVPSATPVIPVVSSFPVVPTVPKNRIDFIILGALFTFTRDSRDTMTFQQIKDALDSHGIIEDFFSNDDIANSLSIYSIFMNHNKQFPGIKLKKDVCPPGFRDLFCVTGDVNDTVSLKEIELVRCVNAPLASEDTIRNTIKSWGVNETVYKGFKEDIVIYYGLRIQPITIKLDHKIYPCYFDALSRMFDFTRDDKDFITWSDINRKICEYNEKHTTKIVVDMMRVCGVTQNRTEEAAFRGVKIR